ncbi:MAG TPA: phosphatase PAP2 family protein [Steroidobacteraceae bacterium]|nr:phosphatase PAP2 family protein [Steroidobacteraceae bacterium]
MAIGARRLRTLLPLCAALFVIPLAGCVTTGPGNWGADAALPSLARLKDAAVQSAKDPHVWAPLAGAAVFQIDGWDRKVSNWARENTPVFGSQQEAQAWSDHLRSASSIAYFATVLATPGSDDAPTWLRDKARGLTVQLGAIATTGLATTVLKDATGRTRPNGEGTQSFPSGHSSHAAVLNGLARDNLDAIDMSPTARRVLDVGVDLLGYGTGWARVEAGAHFPADVLAGIALGNYVAGVFDRAFFESGMPNPVSVSVEPVPRGFELELEWRY